MTNEADANGQPKEKKQRGWVKPVAYSCALLATGALIVIGTILFML